MNYRIITVPVEKKTKDTVFDEFESIIHLKYENTIICKAILTLASLTTNFSYIFMNIYSSYVVIY